MAWQAVISSNPPTVGQWVIERATPTDPDKAAIAEVAASMVGAFVAAFDGLARIDRVQADLMRLNDDLSIATVNEAVTIDLDSSGRPIVPQEITFVTAVFLDCAITVNQDGRPQWRKGGLLFYYGCLIDIDDLDRVHKIKGASAEVTITVDDAWFEENDQPHRDALNTALRAWETATGAPITEWSSSTTPKPSHATASSTLPRYPRQPNRQ